MKVLQRSSLLAMASLKQLRNRDQNPLSSNLVRHDGEKVHYLHQPCSEKYEQDRIAPPGILFAPGFHSSMKSTKVQAIMDFCREESLEFTVFEYHGHGESSCLDPDKSNIGRWKSDFLAILDHVASSPRQILIGSSMGAWLMMLVYQERPERICGLLGIASAPDFTSIISEQIENSFSLMSQMEQNDYCNLPTQYDSKGYYRITRDVLKEAENHFILRGDNRMTSFSLDIPIKLIHGKKDKEIHYIWSQRLLDVIHSGEKELILLKEGDHRLSKPDEIECIKTCLQSLIRN